MAQLLSLIDPTILLDVILAIIGWAIKRELHFIRESIGNVKEYASLAKSTADKAHERIDGLLRESKLFP